MITRKDIAARLHHGGMTASRAHRADTRFFSTPVGKCGIEKLDEDRSYILHHPFVEHTTQKRAPLRGRDGKFGQGPFAFVFHMRQTTSVGMGHQPFNNRRELQILAADVFEELIKRLWLIGIIIVYHGQRIPLHFMFLQQPDAVHHLLERGFPGARLPVCVVKRLRPVDGNAHQPSVVVEEPAIVVGKQRAVGLDTIVYHMAVGILALQVHRFRIEGKR